MKGKTRCVAAGLFHAGYGLYSIIEDYHPAARWRAVLIGLLAVGLIWFVYIGLRLPFFHV